MVAFRDIPLNSADDLLCLLAPWFSHYCALGDRVPLLINCVWAVDPEQPTDFPEHVLCAMQEEADRGHGILLAADDHQSLHRAANFLRHAIRWS